MATSVATAGIGALSGEIKFSQLRNTFRRMQPRDTFSDSETFDTSIVEVSASELLRDTTSTNPNVPDAKENAAIATTKDWKPSQFNNTLKYYYVQQTGNEEDYNIGSQNWNDNLNKSISKFAYIDGTCGSSSPTIPAAKLTTTSMNMRIDVSGNIYGSKGTAGLAGGTFTGDPNLRNGGPGGKGGSSLEVNASPNNIVVFVRSTAKILSGGGGGGGGGRGGDGGKGGAGTYQKSTGKTCVHFGGYCGGCPSTLKSEKIAGNCGTHRNPKDFHHCCQEFDTYATTASARRDGGEGGDGNGGGIGMGWNKTTNTIDNPTTGGTGLDGTDGKDASNNAGRGGDGGKGGDGGDGGQQGNPGIIGKDGDPGDPGDNGNASGETGIALSGQPGGLGGEGGPAGDALTGADYSYTGIINTTGSKITVSGFIVGGIQL